MDKYLGDLADIVRASGGASNNNFTTTTTTTSTANTAEEEMSRWEFGSSDTTNSNHQHSYDLQDLYTFADPLLREIDAISSPGSFLDMGADETAMGRGSVFSNTGGPMQQVSASAPSSNLCNMFSSRMVQILPHGANSSSINRNSSNNDNNSSSNSNSNISTVKLPILSASPKVMKTSFGFMPNEMMSMNASCSTNQKGGFIDGGATGVDHQIPSPRNSGIKRRKSQAKKVVCIPAPAAANSRQTGEVVPSDLWAWRKYGQKPIKGSPFPRGYYRCSSSKGCPARKQVERSRTDPNMLVITYTSEHNHPWPTQRNALAGSSRSQPSKGTTTTLPSQTNDQLPPSKKEKVLVKQEIDNNEATHGDNMAARTVVAPRPIKEEAGVGLQTDNIVGEQNTKGGYDEDDQIDNSFRPIIMSGTPPQQKPDQDFFAELVEFEDDDDPLNLLFTQESKGTDQFSGFFDWTLNNTTTTTTTTTTTEDCGQQNNTSTSVD